MLSENAMMIDLQNKSSRKTRPSSVTEEIEVIELRSFEPEVAPPKKAIEADENSTQSRPRKMKEGTTIVKPKDRTTMENTTENPACIGKALEISAVEKV